MVLAFPHSDPEHQAFPDAKQLYQSISPSLQSLLERRIRGVYFKHPALYTLLISCSSYGEDCTKRQEYIPVALVDVERKKGLQFLMPPSPGDQWVSPSTKWRT